jgi:frataxin-like iron-binding protein CyaY
MFSSEWLAGMVLEKNFKILKVNKWPRNKTEWEFWKSLVEEATTHIGLQN